jgi:predicted transcriptional regulator
MKEPRRPTDAELAILRVLWMRGPSTVRDVFDALGGEGAYTTVLKLLQIMTDKGLVRRDDTERTHVYEAAYSEDQTQKQLVIDLLARVFDGSAAKLVLQALEAGRTTPGELAEIRELLDKHREATASRGLGKQEGSAQSRSGRPEGTASSRSGKQEGTALSRSGRPRGRR